MTPREVVKVLKADGWYALKGRGTGHTQFKHPEKSGKVTVSMHPGDIPLPTLKKIEKQAGITLV